MKILFSVPIMSYISDLPPILPDLGLGYLAASARKEGHTVDIRDWNMPPAAGDYISYLKKERPQVVAMKVFTKDVGATVRTVETIKSVDPSIMVIAGGPHPSAAPVEEVFDDLKGVDFVFRGEAETGLPMLLKYLGSSKDTGTDSLKKIPGLVWKDNGSIIANNPQFIDVTCFDVPAWDLLNPSGYPSLMGLENLQSGNSAPFITSRGCPGVCGFCSVKMISGKLVRRRPLKVVIDEMLYLYHECSVRFLMIMDNGFLTDENYVQDLCEAMIERKINIKWDCVLIDTGKVLKEHTVKLMKKAGCVMVNLGIESGSPRIRKMIKKINTMEEVREIVSLFRKNDVSLFGFFMLGFPGETRADIQESVRIARELDFKMVSFTLTYPIPGTEVYRFLLNKYKIKKIDWASFDIHSSPYPLSEMTSRNLSNLARRLNLEFMIRKNPQTILKKSLSLVKKRVFGKINNSKKGS